MDHDKRHLCVHIHHTIHHNSSTFLTQKIPSARPGKCPYKRKPIPEKPEINHKTPQLTTNAEHCFFPQQIGRANTLDFDRLTKAPSPGRPPSNLS
jgi:hypothetical protein